MKKELPHVFANELKGEIKNNEKVFFGTNKRNEKDAPSLIGKNVIQKINTIFRSDNYVYKADVEITLDNGTVVKKIIGRNNTHLITMENELIPISSIVDINYKKKS